MKKDDLSHVSFKAKSFCILKIGCISLLSIVLCQCNENSSKATVLNSMSDYSEIICPKCGFKKNEKLPSHVCQIKHACDSCCFVMHPKDGDCCVFCSYGSHKCQSMQE